MSGTGDWARAVLYLLGGAALCSLAKAISGRRADLTCPMPSVADRFACSAAVRPASMAALLALLSALALSASPALAVRVPAVS